MANRAENRGKKGDWKAPTSQRSGAVPAGDGPLWEGAGNRQCLVSQQRKGWDDCPAVPPSRGGSNRQLRVVSMVAGAARKKEELF